MATEVKRVESRSEWQTFIGLPWALYDQNSPWVPPLRAAVKGALDTAKNPFYRHARLRAWLAMRDGRAVGRIAGIIDQRHNDFHGEQAIFFGFFECEEDLTTARVLLDRVTRWGRQERATLLRGPISPSTNHECGLLIEGFEFAPRIMMPYNPRYYVHLLEGCGLAKAMDLTAWEVNVFDVGTDKLMRVARRQAKKNNIRLRPVNLSRFEEDLGIIMDIYNSAWEKNWGFVPMDREEFEYLARDFRQILDPELLLIAEVNGDPAAFSLNLPNINQALMKIRSGRLTPLNILRLLWYLKGPGRKSTITECRFLTLGVKKQYQRLALGPLMYMEYMKRGEAIGIYRAEASWVLETNREMISSLQAMRSTLSRRYRIYEMPI